MTHFSKNQQFGELFQKRFAGGICDFRGAPPGYRVTPYSSTLRKKSRREAAGEIFWTNPPPSTNTPPLVGRRGKNKGVQGPNWKILEITNIFKKYLKKIACGGLISDHSYFEPKTPLDLKISLKHGGVRGLVSKIFKNPSKIALEIPINATKCQRLLRLLCKGRFPLYKAPQAKILWYCTSVKVDFPLYKAPQAKKMMYCDSVKVDFPVIKRRRRKFWGIVPL